MKQTTTKKTLTIAHRGAAGYAPENTIAAFKLAIEMKADFLELDIQLTKDGELAVIHDTEVDRTSNGRGKVLEFSMAQLSELDAGSWYSDKFEGERIPALSEVFTLCKGNIGLLIEIKAPWLYPGIEQKLAEELLAHGMLDEEPASIIVQSFDQSSVKRFSAILPQVLVGLLVYQPEDVTVEKLQETAAYADYVNPSLNLVTKNFVDTIHALGRKTTPWTVRSTTEVKPLLDLGVDGIITDYPDYI
ncbi:glycerophosphodiester phosphodiesterase [Bacillus sp. FJAT-28004]|uniref:glycerophosphodiester phosphodiesterase n=1 Tax=Bacillus sp. FJAT-28004 TaxID=1679165 RepID=UPI0006B4414E|nr:glycerophosphodiester phosphodiesterase family protein [Bacillus sp. FJAT-28004]